jgi:beta-N-acetylhexosaminidase
MRHAFVCGLSGLDLTADERAFLADAQPAGVILFARNVEAPQQLRRLTDAARAAIGGDALVLVDQEGGRVQRLRPPHWRSLPAARAYATLPDGVAAARLVAHLTALDLRAVGIDSNCAPVLDLPVPGAHDVIGHRAYATDVATVVAYGRAVSDGLMAGGVLPVIKHMPGHGRATTDSHHDLPVVTADHATLAATDFATFAALAATAPAAMTAHVVFTAFDPVAPASTSPTLHREVIRGAIGFDGLLFSDDLSMQALGAATIAERTRAVVAAGTDLPLHCNGRLEEMQAVAREAPVLDGMCAVRFARALAVTGTSAPLDRAAAEAALAAACAVSLTPVVA